jgi:hypothetical protein
MTLIGLSRCASMKAGHARAIHELLARGHRQVRRIKGRGLTKWNFLIE